MKNVTKNCSKSVPENDSKIGKHNEFDLFPSMDFANIYSKLKKNK